MSTATPATALAGAVAWTARPSASEDAAQSTWSLSCRDSNGTSRTAWSARGIGSQENRPEQRRAARGSVRRMTDNDPTKPIEALAAELRAIAAGVNSTNYYAEGLRGAQLARRLDRDAAEQLWKLTTSSIFIDPALMVTGVLEGVASAALIDGVSSTGVSPSSVINIHNISQASSLAVAGATAVTQLDAILARPDVPEEARGDLEALREGAAQGVGKLSLLERFGKAASKLKEFPLLLAAVTEAVKAFL